MFLFGKKKKAAAESAHHTKAQIVQPAESMEKHDLPAPVEPDGSVRLYYDAEASQRSLGNAGVFYESIRAEIRDGAPRLVCVKYENKADANGELHAVPEREELIIPPEVSAALLPATLREWLSSQRKDLPITWNATTPRRELSAWCYRVRQASIYAFSDKVIPVKNPMPCLEDVGPDGLKNASGVVGWVRLKDSVTAGEAIPELLTARRQGTLVVVTKDPGLLKRVYGELLERCEEKHLWFGLVTADDRLRNLVTGREYRVDWREWPGSADDAATYGEWWLTPLPSEEKARLSSLVERILTDCRAVGVTEERIEQLKQDGLLTEPMEQRCYLRYNDKLCDYEEMHMERGSAVCIFSDRDEKAFRFRFLEKLVYHCTVIGGGTLEEKERMEQMLEDTKERFGDTEIYEAAVRRYVGTFTQKAPRPDPRDREFSRDALRPILYDFMPEGEFFADINTGSFTALRPRPCFDRDWAWRFPSGFYVIVVNERHSVWERGVRLYQNPGFTGASEQYYRERDAFSLLIECAEWNHGLYNGAVHVFLPLDKALREAEERSRRLGCRVAVYCAIDYHDMH